MKKGQNTNEIVMRHASQAVSMLQISPQDHVGVVITVCPVSPGLDSLRQGEGLENDNNSACR